MRIPEAMAPGMHPHLGFRANAPLQGDQLSAVGQFHIR
jgi:hypothetical protein